MQHHPPSPPEELGERDGLAYALFLPNRTPAAGVLILHGAGSAKESHFDFARLARSQGLAALAFDARGHGRSEGRFGPSALDDVLAMAGVLRDHVPVVAFRGSSMGGFCAIHAAARDRGVAAVAAICPAPEDMLLRGLQAGTLEGFDCDVEATERWLTTLSLSDAAASLAPRTALLLLHAEGDEQVPYTVSQELHRVAGRPKRLLLLPGGHHRSIQHDSELQAETLRWIERAVAERAESRP
jgi:alpha-beta hydrolase superfamily lysophospholipase